jgi:hypothetical protein
MATKRQVLSALRKVHEGATLIENDWSGSYDVELEAPKGFHWLGEDVHSLVFHWSDCGNKPEFWDMVLKRCKDLQAVSCCPQCPQTEEGEPCEYWS